MVASDKMQKLGYDPKAIKNAKHFRNVIALLRHKIRMLVKDILLYYKEKKKLQRIARC